MKLNVKGICPNCRKVTMMDDIHTRTTCEHCGDTFLVRWGRMLYLSWWENFWSAAIVIALLLLMLLYELTRP